MGFPKLPSTCNALDDASPPSSYGKESSSPSTVPAAADRSPTRPHRRFSCAPAHRVPFYFRRSTTTAFLLLVFTAAVAVVPSCNAFVIPKGHRGHIFHPFVVTSTTSALASAAALAHPALLGVCRIGPTTTRATTISRNSAVGRLYVAKSGGKMIQTESQYEEMVLSPELPRPVLVFFSAPWCGPCRLTVPVVKEILKQYAGKIEVVEVCTDDLAQVAEEAGVVSIPTIQFYYGGKALEAHSIVGCVAKSVLANAVEKVLEDAAQVQNEMDGMKP